jgi:hypothetical protein
LRRLFIGCLDAKMLRVAAHTEPWQAGFALFSPAAGLVSTTVHIPRPDCHQPVVSVLSAATASERQDVISTVDRARAQIASEIGSMLLALSNRCPYARRFVRSQTVHALSSSAFT